MHETVTQTKQPLAASTVSAGTAVIVGAITAAAAVLRFVNLGQRSLWLDEAFSFGVAHLNWLDLRKVVMNREANMALYYVLLHYWVKLGGTEFFLRSLSALMGIATVPLVYMLGKRLFGTRTGIAAAALLAAHGFHIRYSQEARSYSLVVLLLVASSLLFVEAVESGSRRAWKWYTVVAILATYAHFFAALVVMAQFASLLLPATGAGRIRSSNSRRSARWIALGCFPLAWFVAFKDKGQLNWIPRLSLQSFHECFYDLAGHGGNLLLAVYAGTALAAIVGMILVWRKLSEETRWRYGLIFLWLIVPIAIPLLVSLRKPIFYPRYLIVSLPALVLLVAAALNRLRPRVAYYAALSALLGLSAFGVRAAYGNSYTPPAERWREASQYIITNSRNGDSAIFYHPFARLPFEYYRGKLSAPDDRPRVVYPIYGDGMLIARPRALDSRQIASDSPVMIELAKQQRVWFVLMLDENATTRELQQWLREHFPHVQPHRFGTIRFFLYSK